MFSQKQDDPVLFVCLFVCLLVFLRSERLWVEELNWIERGKRRWGTSDAISTRHVEFLRRTVHTYSLRLLCNLISCFSFLNFRCNIKVRYCSRYDLAWCRLIDFFFKWIWASARELFLLVDGGVIIDPRPFAFLTAREGSSRCLSCAKEKSFGVENDGGVANNQTPPL